MKYNIFGTKNGSKALVKSGMSAVGACCFIKRNEQCYWKRGFDYLIAIPE